MASSEKRPTPRASGNPAKQSVIQQTLKQEREQRRQAKLEEYNRQIARRRRSRIAWWTVGAVAAVAVVVVVIASFVFAPRAAEYEAGGTGATISGVETFDNGTDHVEGSVDYPQTPPAGGPHNMIWLNCGVYTEPQADENAVHALEHGAVWITYDADAVQDEELQKLRDLMPSSYAVLSPYEGLDTPIAVSAWNAQLKVDSADDSRIGEFFEEYWRNQNVPEPNAACTGGIDGPGKA